jgi:CRISPR-associated endonuclease/helicase Cas3
MATESFKSFEEIWKDFPSLSEHLKNHLDYLAHTSHSDDKEHEPLIDHVELVVVYSLRLIKTHHLDKVVDDLIRTIIKETFPNTFKLTVANYLKKLFLASIVFHDYGKVNENFQIEKMKNLRFSKKSKSNGIDSQHSIVNTFLFIHFFLNEIKNEFSNDDVSVHLSNIFVCLFSNSILKHHASYLDHYIGFGERKESLKQYLDLFGYTEEQTHSNLIWDNVDENYLQLILGDLKTDTAKPFKFSSYFPFYALMKLNFSLLTASDQYATGDFMSDMKFDEFGTLSDDFKDQLLGHFKNNETVEYNGKLYTHFEEFLNLPFENLQERNFKNLNKLRQKMAATAISVVRHNKNERLFFLEAPTGGGKTNISIACALELLKENAELNKVFYVFPFTTLITQTFKVIKESLQIGNESVIQLHSKAGFHSSSESKMEDDKYGKEKLDYLNATFLNYPIALMSHIKFFDVLKGNGKGSNLILHRLANSIVIIDELQSYDPKHWDKVVFILSEYARYFNIRFILMSATLPKIDELEENTKGKFITLNPFKKQFFTNPNFKERVVFNFDSLSKPKTSLADLQELVLEKADERAENYEGVSRVLIEFIKKKTASQFFELLSQDKRFQQYQKYLISGTILEPRRREIIEKIKSGKDNKIIVVSTQVIEAGVDIDMDIGFKNRSLIDSDEQFAGRVNRNASKEDCEVYLFLHDPIQAIYGTDERYKVTREKISMNDYQEILSDKNFDKLYSFVNEKIIKKNNDPNVPNIDKYKALFKYFKINQIKKDFQLIENDTETIYVPLKIKRQWFSSDEVKFLDQVKRNEFSKEIDGASVFLIFKNILTGEKVDWTVNAIHKQKIYGIMSKFMFSVYPQQAKALEPFCDPSILESYGIHYLLHHEKIYTYDGGIIDEKVPNSQFL